MTDLMYTPLENVFAATMEREGKNIKAWSNGKEFVAFFRRCDDGQSTEDRINVYYGVDAPVEQGSLIQYGRKTYVLMNKETEENTCYYKSFGIATNGLLNSNNGTIKDVPIYGYDMKDGIAYSDKVFTMISVNMEIITENTDTIKELKINDTFNLYGRTFRTDNTYIKDGLFHIIAQVTTNEVDPIPTPEPDPTTKNKVSITSSTDTIKIGGSYKVLNAKIMDDSDNDITANYADATFEWTCAIDREDYTSNCTWVNGTTFNSKRLKMSSDRTMLSKQLVVSVVMSKDQKTLTGSASFKITT